MKIPMKILKKLKRTSSDYIILQKGVALLITLWVLTILTVIVFSFSFMARTETHATLSFKEGVEKKLLAEAGIQRGIMEIFYRNFYKNQTVELEGREVWKVDGTSYTGQIVDGIYSVSIRDESGKVDINAASDVVLKNLFLNIGIPAETVDILVDSIMDWRDSDDLHRINGAEDDYYLSLPAPYEAKDADFDTLEELILVRGMTSDILHGNGDQKGIIDFLTIHSRQNKINVNAAPKEVLMSIPGMTPEIADLIIEYRNLKEIQNIQEVGIPAEMYTFMAPYIDMRESSRFTIDATGYKNTAKGGYSIRATVEVSGLDEFSYLYYKSPANLQ